MMTENPGISFFQRSDYVVDRVATQEPEELEALEDDKRRHLELQDMCKDAFDDLDSDVKHFGMDDSSYLVQTNDRPNSDGLDVMYQVKLRQIELLNQQLNENKDKYETKIAELSRQLDLANTENRQLEAAGKENRINIVCASEKINYLEKVVDELKETASVTENEKKQALRNLEISELTVRDLQHKIDTMERNADFHSNSDSLRQQDEAIKKLKASQRQQIAVLQSRIEKLSSDLRSKESECAKLEHRLTEVQSACDQMLIEKSATINKLATNLEDIQYQYQKLLESNNPAENCKLLASVRNLQTECEYLKSQITQKDLAIEKSEENFGRKYKDEIERIRNKLSESEKEITNLRADRNNCESQIKHLMETIERMKLELKETLSKHETATETEEGEFASLRTSLEECKKEMISLRARNENLRRELLEKDSIIDKYTTQCREYQRTIRRDTEKIVDIELALEKSLKECDEAKKLYIDVCSTKDELTILNEQYEKIIKQLRIENENAIQKIDDSSVLRKKEYAMSDRVKELERELNAAEAQVERIKCEASKEIDSIKLQFAKLYGESQIEFQEIKGNLEMDCERRLEQMKSKYEGDLEELYERVREQAMQLFNEEALLLKNHFQAKMNAANEEIARLKETLDEKDKHVEFLKSKCDASRSVSQIERVHPEIARLKEQLEIKRINYEALSQEWKLKEAAMNEKYAEMKEGLDMMHEKYRKARKIASKYKEIADERSKLLKREQNQRVETLNKIQQQVENAFREQ